MKTCSECLKLKDFSDFYKDKRNIDGYYSKCKQCHNQHTISWSKNNPEIGQARALNWNKNNKERIKEKRRIYMSNPENRLKVNLANAEYKRNKLKNV